VTDPPSGSVPWPVVARAQQPAVPTIGVLYLVPLGASQAMFVDPFRRGLVETGFVDARNVGIEILSADGHNERLPALAADLVLRRVALIFAPTGVAAAAAKTAPQTIPVVFIMGANPVEAGLVASLNRPGGNLTGVAVLGAEIATADS
jgi:putative tryptophan/tyrosine transport system substrate-binding protein